MKTTKKLFLCLLVLSILSFSCKKDESNPDIIPDTKPKTSTNWGIPKLPTLNADFESFFSPVSVIEIHLALTEIEWNGLLNDYDKNNRNETYRYATCNLSANGVNYSFPGVGLRLRGNTSRKRPEDAVGSHISTNQLNRVHFKIKFNHDFSKDESAYGSPSVNVPTNTALKSQQIVTNVKALNLKYNKDDPSGIREAISYDLFRNFGVEVVHTTFAKLYVKIGTESERYLGIYLAFEDIDKTWIKKRYSNSEGTMFKCLWQSFGPADLTTTDYDGSLLSGKIGEELTDPASNAIFSAEFRAYRPAYDLKEDPTNTGVNDLNSFITILNSSPTQEQIENVFDVQSFLRALAVNVMIGMADDYWRGGNNYYLYKNPSQNNKWSFLPYDNDRTFGINTFGPDVSTSSVIHWGDNSKTPCNPVLVKRILENPQYLIDYKAYLTTMVDSGYFTEDNVIARIQQMQNSFSSYTSGYNISNDSYPFSNDLNSFRNYIRSRIAVVNNECR
ncbi:MAG: CotH kinase family protein [Tenuifilaceae bacterium]